MFYVYVLRNSTTNKRYIGYTSNLEERIRRHNTNHAGFTGQAGEWHVIYYEEYTSKSSALKREKFLKSGKGREFLNNLTE